MYSKSAHTAFKIFICGFQLNFPIFQGHALLLLAVAHCKYRAGCPEVYLSNAIGFSSCQSCSFRYSLAEETF